MVGEDIQAVELTDAEIEELLALCDRQQHDLKIFMQGVVATIGEHPDLTNSERRVVHSYKCRLKDRSHLKEKITRKLSQGRNITQESLFDDITDLAGVRIMHLFQHDFGPIDQVIRQKVSDGDWVLDKNPKAYTWDPEAAEYFRRFDLKVTEKLSSYTSVHYLVRPRKDSPLCCEIQVRTLFEEIWGEVDHQINYPKETENLSCKEQLMVLSKIVCAGSRLLDSLKRVHDSHNEN